MESSRDLAIAKKAGLLTNTWQFKKILHELTWVPCLACCFGYCLLQFCICSMLAPFPFCMDWDLIWGGASAAGIDSLLFCNEYYSPNRLVLPIDFSALTREISYQLFFASQSCHSAINLKFGFSVHNAFVYTLES